VDYLQLDWEIGIGSVGSLSTTLSVIKAGNFFTCELTVSKDNYSSSPLALWFMQNPGLLQDQYPASLSVAIFLQPLRQIFFRPFSTLSNQLFLGFSVTFFPHVLTLSLKGSKSTF